MKHAAVLVASPVTNQLQSKVPRCRLRERQPDDSFGNAGVHVKSVSCVQSCRYKQEEQSNQLQLALSSSIAPRQCGKIAATCATGFRVVELENRRPGRETGHHTAAVPHGYVGLHTQNTTYTTLSGSSVKILRREVCKCVVIRTVLSVSCRLSVPPEACVCSG